MQHPKISIVTPSYNQAAYLEQTIVSVLSQCYPNLEYIIIDGESSDGSVDIIRRYEQHLAYWVSEPDQGMYAAIQKGFLRSTGQIMAWLNSDDLYHANALFTVAEIFSTYPQVNWLTGAPTLFDEKGRTVLVVPARRWSKYHFYLHDFQWVQQESTFWSRSLWEQAGKCLDTSLKLAGDFELWLRFFRYEKLYSVPTILGGYRARVSNQKSLDFNQAYLEEVQQALRQEQLTQAIRSRLAADRNRRERLRRYPWLRYFGHSADSDNAVWDAPPLIEFDRYTQTFVLQ